MKTAFLNLIMCGLCLFAGCSDNNKQGRIAVSGKVFLDGNPLPFGNIEFSSKPDVSPAVLTGCPVKNGRFTLNSEFGLIPEQEYLVKIRAVQSTPVKGADPMGENTAVSKELVPEKYNVKSNEYIKADKESVRNLKFDLKSK